MHTMNIQNMQTGTMYNDDKLNALIQWNEQKKKVAQDIKRGDLMACAQKRATSHMLYSIIPSRVHAKKYKS